MHDEIDALIAHLRVAHLAAVQIVLKTKVMAFEGKEEFAQGQAYDAERRISTAIADLQAIKHWVVG